MSQSEFLSQLKVSRLPAPEGEFWWELDTPLLYRSALLKRTIIVPAHFKTDFASVPRLPLVFALFGDTAHASAVIHDYLFRFRVVKNSLADKVFLEAMQVEGVSWWRRQAMYLAVRAYTMIKGDRR